MNIKDATEADKIKALAELDGWKLNPVRNGEYYPSGLHPLANLNQYFPFPRYLASYDAIIPLWQKVSKQLPLDVCQKAYITVYMTPTQIANAVLIATGRMEA